MARVGEVQYNLSAKGRVHAYLSGFDPQWSRFSPGAVLLGYSIRQAIEEGAIEFDFLRRPEPFKYAWGAHDRFNRELVLSRAEPLANQAGVT
jgi:CelD/BcsL family acetyltransferase involved in cellulose biosynthesis